MYVYNCDNSYKSESLWLENFIFFPLATGVDFEKCLYHKPKED